MKKFFVRSVAVGLLVALAFLVFTPRPLTVVTHEQAYMLLYTSELPEETAASVALILGQLREYRFTSQEDFVEWLHNESWPTPSGQFREVVVKPKAWDAIEPSIILDVILTNTVDGSRTTYRYRLRPHTPSASTLT